MRIQIDGTNALNKGAELMLYAVLQEIERRYPEAEVLYNSLSQKSSYIQTTLNFKTRPFTKSIIPILNKCKIPGILRRLSLPSNFLSTKYPIPCVDIVFDASGFLFSDQWEISDYNLLLREKYYQKLKEQRTIIIFLPQAFGPFETLNGKKMARVISEYADIIFVREMVSYNYLCNAGVDKNKVQLYPDFTALVEGVFPQQYEFLKGGICIIPNMRMIDKGAISKENYLLLICQIIEKIRKNGMIPFLLNHEGKKDACLCKMINNRMKTPLVIVDNMTALEVKGIISKSYLLISSRFHGVASALNSGVPCLATSWSHKYEELFRDYNQFDCLLDINNMEETLNKIELFLSERIHNNISEKLKAIKHNISEKNKEMWEIVWSDCVRDKKF